MATLLGGMESYENSLTAAYLLPRLPPPAALASSETHSNSVCVRVMIVATST